MVTGKKKFQIHFSSKIERPSSLFIVQFIFWLKFHLHHTNLKKIANTEQTAAGELLVRGFILYKFYKKNLINLGNSARNKNNTLWWFFRFIWLVHFNKTYLSLYTTYFKIGNWHAKIIICHFFCNAIAATDAYDSVRDIFDRLSFLACHQRRISLWWSRSDKRHL